MFNDTGAKSNVLAIAQTQSITNGQPAKCVNRNIYLLLALSLWPLRIRVHLQQQGLLSVRPVGCRSVFKFA